MARDKNGVNPIFSFRCNKEVQERFYKCAKDRKRTYRDFLLDLLNLLDSSRTVENDKVVNPTYITDKLAEQTNDIINRLIERVETNSSKDLKIHEKNKKILDLRLENSKLHEELVKFKAVISENPNVESVKKPAVKVKNSKVQCPGQENCFDLF